MTRIVSLKHRLLFSTAMAGAAFFSYGRQAYAACVNSGAATYLCSGTNAATQTISANEATVSTAAGFGVNTNAGNGITITGDGALSFTDTNASTITTTAGGRTYGLSITAAADDGGTPGSVTIAGNSNITGGFAGIGVYNQGTGAVSITANGNVTGTHADGISASNSFTGTGQTITITTGTGSHVTGGYTGINAENYGTGALSITANGDVTGTGFFGIYARNSATNLAITTGSGSNVTGGFTGIGALNYGTSATSITVDGDVTGTSKAGIQAYNSTTGTNLTIATGAGSHVTGDTNGIAAYNHGTGALSITANGDVTGTTGYGILAKNYGTSLTVTTGTSSNITGYGGIRALNHGTEALSITAYGDVTGTSLIGILAQNYGTDLTITTAAGSTVTGGKYDTGILAKNHGTGAMSMTIDGDVTSANYGGVFATNYGTNLTVTTGARSHVTGNTYGIAAYNQGTGTLSITVNGDVTGTTGAGIYAKSTYASNQITVQNGGTVSGNIGIEGEANTKLNVTLNGGVSPVTVTGTGGTAIQLGNQGDSLTLGGTVTIHGDVVDGSGANTLNLGAGTFSLPDAGHDTISGFQTLNVTGPAVVDGNINAAGNDLSFSGAGHSLTMNGTLTATSLTIGPGATFGGSGTLAGNLVIAGGGTLAPGDPTTTNVNGNVTFNTGSTFQVQVDGNSADRLNATGNVTIQSGVTLDVVPLAGFSGTSATFLTAGGALSGTFATVDTNGLAGTVIYDATTATLLAASPNQLNAQALSTQENNLLFTDTVADEAVQGALEKEKYVWMKGLATNDQRDASGNYAGFNDNIFGLALGGEQAFAEHWKLGFALGQLESNTNVRLTSDSSHDSGTLASVYSTYAQPAGGMDVFSTLGLTAGYHALDGRRSVTNSGVPAVAQSSNDATAGGIFLQLGLRSALNDGWSLLPKASGAYTRIDTGGFTEQGGGAAGISMNGYSFGSWKTFEGVTLAQERGTRVLSDIIVKPHVTLGLSQEYESGGCAARGSFSNATPLTLGFDCSNQNFVDTGAGLDFNLADNITGFVVYQNEYSHNETRNEAKAGVTITF